jgi:hypothetical protein
MEGNQGDAITKAPEAIGGFLACKFSMSGVRVLCLMTTGSGHCWPLVRSDQSDNQSRIASTSLTRCSCLAAIRRLQPPTPHKQAPTLQAERSLMVCAQRLSTFEAAAPPPAL